MAARITKEDVSMTKHRQHLKKWKKIGAANKKPRRREKVLRILLITAEILSGLGGAAAIIALIIEHF